MLLSSSSISFYFIFLLLIIINLMFLLLTKTLACNFSFYWQLAKSNILFWCAHAMLAKVYFTYAVFRINCGSDLHINKVIVGNRSQQLAPISFDTYANFISCAIFHYLFLIFKHAHTHKTVLKVQWCRWFFSIFGSGCGGVPPRLSDLGAFFGGFGCYVFFSLSIGPFYVYFVWVYCFLLKVWEIGMKIIHFPLIPIINM